MHNSKISVANNIYIVGCGGVASWLLPVLIKLLVKNSPPPIIHLIDGDKLEKRNLDRQLFRADQIGQFKSEALFDRYRSEYPMLVFRPDYFMEGAEVEPQSLYLGCADNHSARRTILSAIDARGGRAIIGGNEYTDAEAYVYEPEWQATPLDPRVFYPDILTDQTGDPTRPASCQGMAQVQNPQLVLANSSAANHMLGLFWFYHVERFSLRKEETFHAWPTKHSNNFSRFSTELVGKRLVAT